MSCIAIRPWQRATVQSLLVGAIAASTVTAEAFGPSQLVPVEFATTQAVGFGNSVFVSGAATETGGGDVTRSAKLYYTTGDVWRGKIGLPPGTAQTLQYKNRTDGPSTIGNSGNGTNLGGTFSVNVPTTSVMPRSTKFLYYHTGWTAPQLQVETAPSLYQTISMTDAGPGRSVGERRWLANGFSTGGSNVRFRVTDGAGNFDLAPGGVLYDTPLDTIFLQDGQIFNYVPAPSVSASRKETITSVASPQGLLARNLRIYLPRGYDEHTTRRYPVLYMHDGQNLYGTTGSGFPSVRWNVDGALDTLIARGVVREVIVVGIDNTSDRLTDYTPPSAPSGGVSGGRGDLYLAYVRDTVKPLIDGQYRTLTGSAHTGTAGSSLGGLIATYFGLEAPGTFSRIGAHSPAYWANLNVVTRIDSISVLPAWRHYLDSGTAGGTSEGSPDGFARCFDVRDRMLRRGQTLNIEVLHRVGFGEQHNEQAWQNRFPFCAQFLFPIEDEATTLSTPSASVAMEWRAYAWANYGN